MNKSLWDLEGTLEIIQVEEETSENDVCTQMPLIGFYLF